MKFQIDWNRGGNDVLLKEFGAKLIELDVRKYPPYEYYEIELNTLEEMEALHRLIFEKTKKYYSLVVDFDSPTIFLDADI